MISRGLRVNLAKGNPTDISNVCEILPLINWSMGVEWITYNSENILSVNFLMLSQKQILDRINTMAEIVSSRKEVTRVIINVAKAPISNRIIISSFKLREELEALRKSRIAIIGVDGMKSFFLEVYNRSYGDDLQSFSSEEVALEYLIKND